MPPSRAQRRSRLLRSLWKFKAAHAEDYTPSDAKVPGAEDDPPPAAGVRDADDDPPPDAVVPAAEDDPPPDAKVPVAEDDPRPDTEAPIAEEGPPPDIQGRATEDDPPPEAGVRGAEDDPPPDAKVPAAEDDPRPEVQVQAAEDDPLPDAEAPVAEDDPPPAVEVREAEADPPQVASCAQRPTANNNTVNSLLKDINRALFGARRPDLGTHWPAALLSIQEHHGWDGNMPVKDEDLARAKKCILTGLLYMFHEHASTIPKAREAMSVVTSLIKSECASGTARESHAEFPNVQHIQTGAMKGKLSGDGADAAEAVAAAQGHGHSDGTMAPRGMAKPAPD
mmetsp:Transcript_61542/g.190605  ORF Transcript_61542/g.190605 Transcript_61542/m.190605 type:complete len:338 (+) Transcript_61542:95-1108(+)